VRPLRYLAGQIGCVTHRRHAAVAIFHARRLPPHGRDAVRPWLATWAGHWRIRARPCRHDGGIVEPPAGMRRSVGGLTRNPAGALRLRSAGDRNDRTVTEKMTPIHEPLADARDMFAAHTMFRCEFGLMPGGVPRVGWRP
jgi:hypothetical protein